MMTTKIYTKIKFILSIYVVTVLLSCNQGQKINIIGYAYRGEKVIVKDKEKVVVTIRADSSCDERGGMLF